MQSRAPHPSRRRRHRRPHVPGRGAGARAPRARPPRGARDRPARPRLRRPLCRGRGASHPRRWLAGGSVVRRARGMRSLALGYLAGAAAGAPPARRRLVGRLRRLCLGADGARGRQRAGVPPLLHEQNAVLGRANRLLARAAAPHRHLASPAGSAPALGRAGPRLTGNPVRPAIAALGAQPYAARRRTADPHSWCSAAARARASSRRVVPAAIARLAPERCAGACRCRQQARPEDLEAVRSAYARARHRRRARRFFADVPARLARAHLVISRAGASTVAELAAAGRPAILRALSPSPPTITRPRMPRAFAAPAPAGSMPEAELDAGQRWPHGCATLLADPARARRAAAARAPAQPARRRRAAGRSRRGADAAPMAASRREAAA